MKPINLIIITIIFLFTECKKDAIKYEEILGNNNNSIVSTNMRFKFKNTYFEYTSNINTKTNVVDFIGKDADTVKKIINDNPEAVAVFTSKTEVEFFKDFKAYTASVFNESNANTNNRLLSNMLYYNVTATFYKNINFDNQMFGYTVADYTSIGLSASTTLTFNIYKHCDGVNVADEYCPTNQSVTVPGFAVSNVGNIDNDQYSSIKIIDFSEVPTVFPVEIKYNNYQLLCFEDANYGGRCLAFSVKPLNNQYNSGNLISNLTEWKRNVFYKTWNDQISSVKGFIYFK